MLDSSLEYDEAVYAPTCANCGAENSFKRERTLTQVHVLDLEGGWAEISDEDEHVTDEWRFECDRCGNSSSELIDILTELPDEEEEDEDA